MCLSFCIIPGHLLRLASSENGVEFPSWHPDFRDGIPRVSRGGKSQVVWQLWFTSSGSSEESEPGQTADWVPAVGLRGNVDWALKKAGEFLSRLRPFY